MQALRRAGAMPPNSIDRRRGGGGAAAPAPGMTTPCAGAPGTAGGGLRRSTIVWSETPAFAFTTTDVLQDRLEELTVFELRRDGGRRHLSVSVRLLYKYVLSAITASRSGNAVRVSVSHPLPLGRAMLQSPASPAGFRGDVASADAADSPPFRPMPASRSASTGPYRRGRGGEGGVTYRERLGGYLHPRDMRRLVTPFVASNEPEIIVRRHCMLLNFDPVRAIILRDRLLLLVPDGADDLTGRVEKILKGDLSSVIESTIEGKIEKGTADAESDNKGYGDMSTELGEPTFGNVRGILKKKPSFPLMMSSRNTKNGSNEKEERNSTQSEESLETETDAFPSDGGGDDDDGDDDDSEWADLKRREWIDLPFELQCLDAVLLSVCEILCEDTLDIQQATRNYIERVLSSRSYGRGSQDPLSVLRALKDAVKEMSSRVKGFVKSLSRTLDEDEDMALMNLSRLLTNPEIFIQPVSPEVLEEESDEPELILGT